MGAYIYTTNKRRVQSADFKSNWHNEQASRFHSTATGTTAQPNYAKATSDRDRVQKSTVRSRVQHDSDTSIATTSGNRKTGHAKSERRLRLHLGYKE